MFIRECAGDWHLWKGGGGSRKRHRKRLSCDVGWTTSAKPTGSSEAEMMAHWRCSKSGRNRQAFTSPDPPVSGCGCSSEGEAALWSWGCPWRSRQLTGLQHSQKLGQQVLPWRGIWEAHLCVHPRWVFGNEEDNEILVNFFYHPPTERGKTSASMTN